MSTTIAATLRPQGGVSAIEATPLFQYVRLPAAVPFTVARGVRHLIHRFGLCPSVLARARACRTFGDRGGGVLPLHGLPSGDARRQRRADQAPSQRLREARDRTRSARHTRAGRQGVPGLSRRPVAKPRQAPAARRHPGRHHRRGLSRMSAVPLREVPRLGARDPRQATRRSARRPAATTRTRRRGSTSRRFRPSRAPASRFAPYGRASRSSRWPRHPLRHPSTRRPR